MDWINVEDRLPEENKYVLILNGSKIEVARIEKGISKEERDKMKCGELPERKERCVLVSGEVLTVNRSDLFKGCDEWTNNLVPYKWYAQSGPMQWQGQDVSHWMPLPEPPKGE